MGPSKLQRSLSWKSTGSSIDRPVFWNASLQRWTRGSREQCRAAGQLKREQEESGEVHLHAPLAVVVD